MENEVDIITRRMIRAIGNIQQFADRTYNFDTGKDFLTIHQFNIESLNKLSQLRNNEYYLEKLAEYPEFTEKEIDYALFQRFNNRLVQHTEEKLQLLGEINKNIQHVLSHPGMDEMIKSAK